MTAQGWFGPGSYAQERWNWIDFLVVAMGYLSLLPSVSSLSGVRVFRVLRPLRTLTSLPSLRIIVQSLLASLPALFSVALMAAFILMVFGIIGVQLWAGVMRGECGFAGSGIPCARECTDALCQPAYGDRCPVGYVYTAESWCHQPFVVSCGRRWQLL